MTQLLQIRRLRPIADIAQVGDAIHGRTSCIKPWGSSLATILILAHFGVAQAANDIFRVTLLGTGSPVFDPNRFSASTLIEAGDQKLLIDERMGREPSHTRG
jgi:hypothetical protein